ncbi:Zinc transporter ZitB [Klebsiella michiganensis]|uniref:Zinc transporter ZitB n=1 Tax=Klebsiella michiganensis TaxID=1134687 RepID=A0A7H4N3Q8_9ENTR|nr:Zinc transporter ZitB [Klebsiella michiganensis]
MLQESVNELLEGAPRSLDVDALKRDLRRSIPEVRDVHHVHAWLVGEKTVMTLHVQVVPPHDHDGLLERIQASYSISMKLNTLRFRWEYQPCSGPECRLNMTHAGHGHHHHH